MITAVVLIVCLWCKTEGGSAATNDSLNDVPGNNDDEDYASGSGGGNERAHYKIPCCISGNFTFHPIDDILKNISSDNTIVNITTDVVLSSNVTLEGLENIMIIGHRNPVVKCNDVGTVKFISFKNLTIEGIQWEGCGSKDYPAIEYYNSSNVSFERCSFHDSKGKSVLLSQVSGNVYINNCNFTHKIEYSGHGAAIHYSPNTNSYGQYKLMVQNSQFIFNRATQSVVYIDGSGSRITGHVCLQDNVFVNNTGAPIYISHTNLHIRGSLLIKGNTAKSGGGIYSNNSTIIFYDKSDVHFIGNSVTETGGAVYQINTRAIFEGISIVTFEDNSARSGGAIYGDNSNITFDGNSSVVFSNNEVNNDGGAVFSASSSHIIFDGNSSVSCNNNKAKFGGAVSSTSSSHIIFDGNSSVTFNNNNVSEDGGAVFCSSSSHITFDGNSSVTMNNNEASHDGGSVHCWSSSYITFDGNSSVTFNNNKASHLGGSIFCIYSSHITFDGNSSATFNNNIARYGGAVYGQESSHITFDGNSSATFNNNEVSNNGGAVFGRSFSLITFNGNSSVTFNSNEASDNSGAIHCRSGANIAFDGYSTVTFNNNKASDYGGAVFCGRTSHVIFDGYSSVTFNSNKAGANGGAVYCEHFRYVTFHGNSSVLFNNNKASNDGGAVYIATPSDIIFDGNSSVTFNSNEASDDGGAVYGAKKCNVLFFNSAFVIFINNSAKTGGVILSQGTSYISAKGNSTVQFIHNTATRGAAIYSRIQATVLLEENCKMTFKDNKATESGGAFYITAYSTAIFTGHSEVTYFNNEVSQYGGAIYCSDNSTITVDENNYIEFTNNTSEYGGAVSIAQSTLTFEGNSLAKFQNNIAERGGTFYMLLSIAAFKGNVSVNFSRNTAENGGAISAVKSSVTFAEKSQLCLFSNSATGSGGAMHLSDHFFVNISHNSHVTFYHNTADRHGGAIYCDLTKSTKNKITFSTTDIVFDDNTDLTGSDIYVDMPTSCDEMCFNNSVINKGYNQFGGVIKTSPRKLEFNDSAVTCIDNDTNCQTYLTRNIMLGQEIMINACVRDYFNQTAEPTQFVLSSEDQNHNITGPDNVLISCALLEGVSIMGEKILDVTNYSINVTSYDGNKSELKLFFVQLILELSPCQPGFHYDNDNATLRCVCYSNSDVVSCSGSTSSIKRGYWFGEVNDIATVTICPNNYCNFTCCETANGFFELSPVRANQCNLHRSGTACGGCKEGFTLSFDSIECVSVDTCTTGQTVLVVTLSILYWVVIVILVFIVTYYHIGIGYLYAITYYYSMVDILLSERLYSSQGLLTFVSIMSSIAKVTPQFLGQLCLVTDMSGIDQQVIHYVHPLAVTIIIVVICISARISYKFSSFVSKGIIHVICFLLLLSYTSVATTSLLLLRSLTFDNVDKVYTYLSPDIEYFHGRHLPYVITAIVCSLIIVMGLPLLLLLEPFLNHKINFNRIKPLLDQFQGCYKDKYRTFAAYYMTCRVVIILIIIANPSNNNTTQYSLIIANSTLALIHVTIKPYESNILNVFDGFVLQLMIVVSMVPLIDSYDHDLLLSFILALVILPLLPFLIMEIYLYKQTIIKITKYCLPPRPDTINDNNEVPMRDFTGHDSDDIRRVNTTTCEIRESKDDDATHWRDSFMEVMDEIQD
ncbi:uncharacterized protein [Dysidea avara]|uniref:uncharacterized protein n=1 Tax=Dysidea avara TaxID=196820 RepID=UPI00331E1468